MTRTATYVFVILCFVCSAHAEDTPLPEKAQKLRESYRAAVDRATTPLTKTYLAELQRLKIEYTKAADLKGALAIENEISLLTPTTKNETPPNNAKEKLTKRESIKDLIARTWEYHDAGTAEDTPGPIRKTVTFLENGTATYAETPGARITWSIESNGELLYQPESPKFKAKFRRSPNGTWIGKGYGEMADAMGIAHLIPKP
ncbi:MAG: hypothetical protein ABL962_16625 [Fimbriimonadaceae bacterium]